MNLVDQWNSWVIPLRNPVKVDVEMHSWQSYGDVAVCRDCGVEAGTAASTWPCGDPTPAVRVDAVEKHGVQSVRLVNQVYPSLVLAVEEKIRQFYRSLETDSGDEEIRAAEDMADAARRLIETIWTT